MLEIIGGKIMYRAQAILKGKTKKRMFKIENVDDWTFAKSGCPEKLYGFQKGKFFDLRFSIINDFHGYV